MPTEGENRTVTVPDGDINTKNLLHQTIISSILVLALLWLSLKIYEKHRHALRPHVTAQILFLGDPIITASLSSEIDSEILIKKVDQ